MFIIPAPLFLRLAYIREKNNLSLRSVADILGISQSHLYDLEEFAKAPDISLLTKKGRLYDTILHFISMYDHCNLFDDIQSMESKDQFFFSLMPCLSNVYIDLAPYPSYWSFFEFFLYDILIDRKETKIVICAPTDMTTAIMLNYAFSRVWSHPSRRRKIIKRLGDGDISYIPYEQQIEPGKPMGELKVTYDIRKILNFTEVYPDKRPYFAYLILYILTKKFYVDFESMRDIDSKNWNSWFERHGYMDIDIKYLDKMPDLPYKAALVLNTKDGDITICFSSLFGNEPCWHQYFIVKGDHLGSGNAI